MAMLCKPSASARRIRRRRGTWGAVLPLLSLLLAAACVPLPLYGPRVQSGFGMETSVAVRALKRDASPESSGGMFVAPEVLAVSINGGFARSDGRGPAFRLAGSSNLLVGFYYDAYVQLPPRSGRYAYGIGVTGDPNPRSSAYLMVGRDLSGSRTLYFSQSLPIGGPVKPDEAGRLSETGYVTLLGLERRKPAPGIRMGMVGIRRLFLAAILGSTGGRNGIPTPPLEKTRSLLVLGVGGGFVSMRGRGVE